MKTLVIALALMLLAACSPSVSDETYSFKLPPDLQDCRIVQLRNDAALNIHYIYLIKCPEGYLKSTSITPAGKTTIPSAAMVY